MENNITTIAFRGSYELITNLHLYINNISYGMPNTTNCKSGQYNIRCIFEKTVNQLTYNDSMLGELIGKISWGQVYINQESNIVLNSSNSGLPEFKVPLNLQGKFFVGIKIFKDTPIHRLPYFDALPIPTETITIYIYFSEAEIIYQNTYSISEKYFDSYNDLGFFLVDIPKMEEIITKKYGNQELDLVYEFTNTEIIDELFNQGVIMITWGIPSYTYTVYSSNSIESIQPLLGDKFKQEGLFYINKNINELSLIPGYELRNWPKFTKKMWPKISLKGKGEIVCLTPYILKDSESETVLVSFLINRRKGILTESIPLLNVNLLYE
jgi:hypothetical protein